jgi:FtsP/CotA-like multicopper oxidase with cupredoxin domain
MKNKTIPKLIFFITLLFPLPSFSKVVRYNLTITKIETNLSGKKTVDWALAVNNSIPAPTLEFTEGDDAEILVQNELNNEEVRGEFQVALVCIRNMMWSRLNQNTDGPKIELKIGAGCGLVQDSQLEREWGEVLLKINSVKRILGIT